MLRDSLLLKLLVAQVGKSLLLPLVVDPEFISKSILQFKLDQIVCVQIPRINRILSIVIDCDICHEVGGRLCNNATHDTELIQGFLMLRKLPISFICFYEAPKRGYSLRSVKEPWLGYLERAILLMQVFRKQGDAVVIEREHLCALFAINYDSFDRLLD